VFTPYPHHPASESPATIFSKKSLCQLDGSIPFAGICNNFPEFITRWQFAAA